MTNFLRVVVLVGSGLVVFGCSGVVGFLVGFLAMFVFGFLHDGLPLSFWWFVPVVLAFYSMWKLGVFVFSLILGKLRRCTMQVAWEKRYGSSFLMPVAPWGRVGDECSMTGVYRVLRGEFERERIERGQVFPLANVERRPHIARWEMMEYPLSPSRFLGRTSLVQRIRLIQRVQG